MTLKEQFYILDYHIDAIAGILILDELGILLSYSADHSIAFRNCSNQFKLLFEVK